MMQRIPICALFNYFGLPISVMQRALDPSNFLPKVENMQISSEIYGQFYKDQAKFAKIAQLREL
jgi:hypothetical protein